MDKKEIKLNLNKTISGVAGFPYGEKIFEEQVRPNLDENDYEKGFIIVFPSNILRVASSFAQGFFSFIIDKIGYYNFVTKIKIESSSDSLSKSIVSTLE